MGSFGITKVVTSNRSRVIQAVVEGKAPSRTQIADATGLSASTVTRVVALLMTEGVLAEDVGRVATEGRSRIPIKINPSYGSVLALSVNRDGITLAEYDMNLKSLGGQRLDHPWAGADDLVDHVAHTVSLTDRPRPFPAPIRGMGVVLGDDIALELSVTRQEQLVEALSATLGIPVVQATAQECTERHIISGSPEDVGANHALVSCGSHVLVSITQDGSMLPMRNGSFASFDLGQDGLGTGELEAQAVERLAELTRTIPRLFSINTVFLRFANPKHDAYDSGSAIRNMMRIEEQLGPKVPPFILLNTHSSDLRRAIGREARVAALCT